MANPPINNEPLHEEKERYVWLPEPSCWRRCALFLRYVNDAIFLIDTQGRIVETNERAIVRYGYSDAEMRALHLKDVRAAEAQAEAQAYFESLRERSSAVYRTVHRRRNGTNFPVEVSARWIKIGDREFVLAVIRDLSEVADASQRYVAAVESAMDGYAVVGAKGQFVEVNAALCALTGYSRHELVCLTVPDIEVVEAQSRTAARMAFIIASGHDRFECQWKRKDGAIIDVEVTATYRAQDSGEFFCFIRDITERKQAGAALRASKDHAERLLEENRKILREIRESEERYGSLVKAMAEGVVMRDASGTIVACNQSAEWILGLEHGQLIGRTSIILEGGAVHEDGSPFSAEDSPSVLALRTGKPTTVTTRGIRTRDGTLIWISGSSQPLFKSGATNPYAVVTTFRDITDRKQAEESLRASEERFRTLVEQSLTGIYAIHDDKITYANPRFAELLGYTLDEITGMNPDSFVVAEDLPRTQANMRALLEGQQQSAAYDFRARRKDGTAIELGLRGVRTVFNGDPAVICMSQDITERKRADEVQARLAAIVENSNDGIISRALDRTITSWNAAAERILGYTAAEVVGRILTAIIPPEQQQKSVELRKLAAAGTSVPYFETVRISKDGQRIDVGLSVSPIRDKSGNLIGTATILRDITERKRAEEVRATLAAIVEHTNDAVIGRALDGTIVSWNAAGERVLGYTAAETIGSDLMAIFPPDLRQEAVANRELVKAGKSVPERETVRIAKDGRHLDVAISISPIKDNNGLIIGTATIMREITERKRAEQNRRQLEAQLREAQKMEAIGTLAGGVAHDFNNQLTVIKGCVQFLLEAMPADDPGREDAERINATVDKGARLIRQLMAFSRKQKIEPRPLSLADLVNEMAAIFGPLLSERISFRVRMPPGLWRVRADPGQIEQLIMNLAVNARDAMTVTEGFSPAGTLTLEIANVELDEASIRSFGETVPPGPYVMLAVSDTGCGMTSEVKRRIFEPFFTTKEPGKGTGLGLSTVFGMVKQHGGHITCESEPGQGSTFRVYLPRNEEEAAPADALTLTATPGPPPRGETVTALIAEDDENVREIVRRGLEASGYQVHVAADPEEALAVASAIRGPIHLLVTDVVMAGGGGQNLAERLRAIIPALKVLFISGYFDDTPTGPEMLNTFFLQKPFSPDDLAQKASEVLGR